ncbi:MAG: hypothetical protein ABFR75_04875 [Acidobacteriota bacterium]
MKFFRAFINKINIERNVINRFRESGACSVDLAKPINEVGEINRSVFNKLKRKGVIETAGRDSYFLNEHGLMKFRMNRAKWGMIVLFLLLGMILLFKGSY